MIKIWGESDDLIEVSGDIVREYDVYYKDVMLVLSDRTQLSISYGKDGIWKIKLLKKGNLFIKIEECLEEKDGNYSDVAFFNDGITFCAIDFQ